MKAVAALFVAAVALITVGVWVSWLTLVALAPLAAAVVLVGRRMVRGSAGWRGRVGQLLAVAAALVLAGGALGTWAYTREFDAVLVDGDAGAWVETASTTASMLAGLGVAVAAVAVIALVVRLVRWAIRDT